MFGGFLPLISLTHVNWKGNPLAGVGCSIASLIPCAVLTCSWAMEADLRPALEGASGHRRVQRGADGAGGWTRYDAGGRQADAVRSWWPRKKRSISAVASGPCGSV